MMINKINCENRIIVFLDILGYKDLFNSDEHRAILFKVLSEINRKNRLYKDKTRVIQSDNKTIRVKDNGRVFNLRPSQTLTIPKILPSIRSISDSIIISLPVNLEKDKNRHKIVNVHNDVIHIINCVSDVVFYLLEYGISTRGAVSFGEVYFNEKESIITGYPIIEAIEAEKKLAIYPRIILLYDFIKYISGEECSSKEINYLPYVNSHFRVSSDGLMRMPFLKERDLIAHDDRGIRNNIKYQRKIEVTLNKIKQQVDLYRINERQKIFSKWQWLYSEFENEYEEAKKYAEKMIASHERGKQLSNSTQHSLPISLPK